MARLSPDTTNAVAEAAADIRGIKPPVEIPSIWTWVLGASIAIAVALLTAWLWRKWRNRPRPDLIARVIPPHERALFALREALRLINEPRPYCQAVSDAVRLYLEERFELHAPERTTEEFLDELQSSAVLSFDQKQTLGEFLTQCDLAKFAKYEPSTTELDGLYQAGVRLVMETQPPPEPITPETTMAKP